MDESGETDDHDNDKKLNMACHYKIGVVLPMSSSGLKQTATDGNEGATAKALASEYETCS